MTSIKKTRREWFGGLVYSENPGFTMFVDSRRADELDIPAGGDLPDGFFSAPLDVHLCVTTRCNLRCQGCYALNHDEPGEDMSLDVAKTIVDRLSEMDVFTIALGGGEPFLYPHMFELAAYARQRRIVPNVTTNGLLVDAETAKKCRVFGSVHVSCHHPSELPRLADPIGVLKRSGIDVGLNVLVSSATYPELSNIWTWCAKQGISRLLLLKFKVTGANHDCHDMILSAEQERSLLPLMRQLARRHSLMPMLDCSFFPALASSGPNKRDLEFFDVNGCVGGSAILAISIDGRFKPCSFCETTYGDARLLSRRVWKENQEMAEFRERRLHGGCRTCTYEKLCIGGCRIAATEWCQN